MPMRANGEVLFDVGSMPDYGGLSRRNLDEQQAGARVAVDAHKKNPADFVLWKQSAADEPGWEAKFRIEGRDVVIRGRPGWHIECSAMSAAYLGEVFDIHGGGLDLIFPHHENEIAQSRCAHGTPAMANYWMHNGFLQVEGKKMAKSEGNFVTIHELLETEKFGGRKWPGEVLRLAMLMTHYREPIDFSVARLEEAEAILQRWRRAVVRFDGIASDADRLKLASGRFEYAAAVSEIASLSSDAMGSAYNRGPSPSVETVLADRLNAAQKFAGLALALGLDLTATKSVLPMQSKMIERRLAFIREKNWAEADKIRDELLQQGIQLKDSKDPATGERVTTWEVKR